MTLINPYTPGMIGPTQAQRTAKVKEIYTSIAHTKLNGCVLFGQRRIGKTSLLLQLRDSLPHMGAIRTVFFDLQDKLDDDATTILRALAAEILERVQRTPEAIKLPTTGQAFRNEFIPKVVSLIGGARLVILFDEFDVLTPKFGNQSGDLTIDHDSAQSDKEEERLPQKRARHARTFLKVLEEVMRDCPMIYMVFSMGRYIEESDKSGDDANNADAAARFFRNIIRIPVPLLTQTETFSIIDRSMDDKSLEWNDDARQAIWNSTNGHPLYVQALCSHVWEALALNHTQRRKVATKQHVEDAIEPVLEKWSHAIDWLWKSLNPACKVITSALAQLGSKPISEQKVFDILRQTGVRSIIPELRHAPALLIQWDLIHQSGTDYHFCVELIRRWIAKNYPLEQTQTLLDKLNPVAIFYYQAAYRHWKRGEPARAKASLLEALTENPNHAHALILLADIYADEGEFDEAEKLLGQVVELQPSLGRGKLLEMLRDRAEHEPTPDKKLLLYERIVEMHPELPAVRAQRDEILRQCGEAAQQDGALEEALAFFQRAELRTKAIEVEALIEARDAQILHKTVFNLDRARDFKEALKQAEEGIERYPNFAPLFTPFRDAIRAKLECGELMRQARHSRATARTDEALRCLLEVVRRDVRYPGVTRELDELVRQPPPAMLRFLAFPVAALLLGVGTTLGILSFAEANPTSDLSPLFAMMRASLEGKELKLQTCRTAQMASTAEHSRTSQAEACPAVVCPAPNDYSEPDKRQPTVDEPTGPVVVTPPKKRLTCAAMRSRVLNAIGQRCRANLEDHDFLNDPIISIHCEFTTDHGDGSAVLSQCVGQGEGESMVKNCIRDIGWSEKIGRFDASNCSSPLALTITKDTF